MPNDWFRKEHVELLTAYCVRASMAEQLARKIAEFRPEWLDEPGGTERLDLLNKMVDREHRAVLALARAMRLTHQAQYQPQKANTLAKNARSADFVPPWDRYIK